MQIHKAHIKYFGRSGDVLPTFYYFSSYENALNYILDQVKEEELYIEVNNLKDKYKFIVYEKKITDSKRMECHIELILLNDVSTKW